MTYSDSGTDREAAEPDVLAGAMGAAVLAGFVSGGGRLVVAGTLRTAVSVDTDGFVAALRVRIGASFAGSVFGLAVVGMGAFSSSESKPSSSSESMVRSTLIAESLRGRGSSAAVAAAAGDDGADAIKTSVCFASGRVRATFVL